MLTRCLAAFTLAAPLYAGDLWTVSASGLADFTTLQDAIDQASSGDVLLVVGPLAQASSTIDSKALSVVAEAPGFLDDSRITVLNLDAQEEVFLAGLGELTWLRLWDNIGRVVVETCRVQGGGVSISASADVVLSDTTTIGSTHPCPCTSGGVDGGDGMTVSNGARATLYGCTVIGGDGIPDCLPTGFDGLPGYGITIHSGGTVIANDSLVEGGMSPDGWQAQGVHIWSSGGSYDVGQTPPAELIGPTLSSEGDVAMLRVEGTPGHSAWLLLSAVGQRRVLPPTIGILHLAPPLSLQFLGTVPGSGLLTAPVTTPQLPSGAQAERLWAQVMLTQSGGARYLGNAKGWVVRE